MIFWQYFVPTLFGKSVALVRNWLPNAEGSDKNFMHLQNLKTSAIHTG